MAPAVAVRPEAEPWLVAPARPSPVARGISVGPENRRAATRMVLPAWAEPGEAAEEAVRPRAQTTKALLGPRAPRSWARPMTARRADPTMAPRPAERWGSKPRVLPTTPRSRARPSQTMWNQGPSTCSAARPTTAPRACSRTVPEGPLQLPPGPAWVLPTMVREAAPLCSAQPRASPTWARGAPPGAKRPTMA